MLNLWFTPRFATSDALGHEQRLCMHAKDPLDPRENKEVAVGGILQPETPDIDIERQIAKTHSDVLLSTPEVFFGEENVQPITHELENFGTLFDGYNAERRAALTAKERHKAFLEILRTPEGTFRAAHVLESRIKTYNEKLALLDRYISQRNDMSPAQAGTFIHANLEALVEAQKNGDIRTSENVVRNLMPEYNLTQNETERENIVDLAVKLSKLHEHVKGFMPEGLPVDVDMQQARKLYIENLERHAHLMKKHLRATMQARIEHVFDAYNLHQEAMGDLNTETALQKFGATASGIQGFFDRFQISYNKLMWTYQEQGGIPLDSPDFLISAESDMDTLKDLELHLTDNSFLGEIKVREEENEEWAFATAPRIDALLQKNIDTPDGDLQKLYALLEGYAPGQTPTLDERCGIRLLPLHEKKRMEATIYTLEQKAELASLTQEQVSFANTIRDVETERTRIRNAIDHIVPDLLSSLSHPVCTALDIPAKIRAKKQELEIELMKQSSTDDPEKTRLRIAAVHLTAQRMERAVDNIRALDSRIEYLDGETFERTKHSNARGTFNYQTGTISINRGFSDDPHVIQETIEHEKGHAIVNILTQGEETALFPFLLIRFYETVKQKADQRGETMFQDLLFRQAERWNVERHEKDSDESYLHKLTDELLAQFADFKTGRKESINDAERKLFSLLEQETPPETEKTPIRVWGEASMARNRSHDGGDDDGDHGTMQSEEGGSMHSEADHREKLGKLSRDLDRARGFFVAFPAYKGTRAEKELHTFEEFYNECERLFQEKEDDTPYFKDVLSALEDKRDQFDDFMAKVDYQNMDLSNLPHHNLQGIRGLLNGIEWMSVYDVVAMFNDMKEDINRMWKRRGEGARARTGKNLTRWISKSVPYLGRLSAEFERRDQASEQEEVGVYEKGLDKVDNHTLQYDLLKNTNNKDHAKAIINILTKRGRLDWEDIGLWQTLGRLSRFSMPISPCRRDNILRNKYLRKLIADIWNDKDLYDEWKTHNDSGIEKGKQSQTPNIDDLSNVTGGLAHELARLLEAQHQHREHQPTREEEINPHLYEGILHYAMKNGKMTMEGKFFYLIRGVEEGLLSIDRLRAFTGEKGGLLGTFPFIDFFDRKNNTLDEIKRIGKRITDSNHPFKPDFRTTIFLETEISRDNAVKDRVNKALKNGQNLDHEDIPMAVTHIDYNGLDNLINVYSGNQHKVSAQGLQNAYIGYNSFFRAFAIMAKMHQERPGRRDIPPLTKADFSKFATLMTAYIFFDNRVTGLNNTGSQPGLSWNQMDNEKPVSCSTEHVTRDYREAMSKFTLNAARAVDMDTEINTISLDDFIGVGRNANSVNVFGGESQKKPFQDKIKTYAIFAQKLTEKIAANPHAFVNVLIAHMDEFIPENEDLTYDSVKKYYEDLYAKRHAAPTANHGVASHGGH